ncbi:MarR family winged helix-turn-helix transcriptional regulator [Streptodolium elevatio]|uniref:MarR family winged helix-turn-helix transcriptional regulator n=1 Tax=Streptodolium elevatio TaxID=3157996 RepID=A0ABV3DKH3_9ACTN
MSVPLQPDDPKPPDTETPGISDTPDPSDAPKFADGPEALAAQRQVQGAVERLLRLQQSRRVHGELMSAARAQVSQPAVILLARLQADGGLTIGELARRTHMDMSLVSRELRKLETEAMVTRATDARDGRVTRVGLTPKGRGIVRRLRNVRDRHIFEVLSAWSAQELVALGDLMTRFVDDLQSVRYRDADTDGSGGPETTKG